MVEFSFRIVFPTMQMSWRNIAKHSFIIGVPTAVFLKTLSMRLGPIDKTPEKYDFKPLPASEEKEFRRCLFKVIDDMGPAFNNLKIQSVKLEKFERIELYSCNHSEAVAVHTVEDRTVKIGLPLEVIQMCCAPRIKSANASESLYLKNTDSLMLSEKARKFVTVKQLIEAADHKADYDVSTTVKIIIIAMAISTVAAFFCHPLIIVTSAYIYHMYYLYMGIENRKKLDLKWIYTYMGEEYAEGACEYFTKIMLRNYRNYQIQAEERKTSWKKSVLFHLTNIIPFYKGNTPIYTCGGNSVKSKRDINPSMGLFIFGKRARELNKWNKYLRHHFGSLDASSMQEEIFNDPSIVENVSLFKSINHPQIIKEAIPLQ